MNRPPHFSMIRGFCIADWFTLANAACGTGAVLVAMRYLQTDDVAALYGGAALVVFALIFDILDGRIARWRHEQSALGRELDSLSDVISFGVAPAALGYAVGMQGLLDCAVLIYFVACGVSRLARYNVTAESMSGESGKVSYFEGTPIPSSVVIVLALAVAAWLGRVDASLWFGSVALGTTTFHPLVLIYALSGSLMISKTLHLPKL